jgi:hypothetical protein
MKKRFYFLAFGFMLAAVSPLFAGGLNIGMYGNINESLSYLSTNSVVSNASWGVGDANTYFQLKLSGLNFEGFNIYAQLSGYADLYATPISSGTLYNMFNSGYGLNSDISNNNALKIQLEQASIQKRIDFSKTSYINMVFYRGQDQLSIDQPYFSFSGTLGDSLSRTGVRLEAVNLAGFTFKGYLLDFRSDYLDLSSSDIYDYAVGGRLTRDILKTVWMNLTLGVTAGFSSYFNTTSVSNVVGINPNTTYPQYFYNCLGADISVNGEIPVAGGYYFFLGVGRSYLPADYPYEYSPLISLTGNSNAMILTSEFKWNKAFVYDKLDFGHLFLGAQVFIRQPDFQYYLGGGDNEASQYREALLLTYQFPVKMFSLNGLLQYRHNYDFADQQYHIWEMGQITDTSATFNAHGDLNIIFKNGFSFNFAWDNEAGTTYLGKFVTNGINYLTFTLKGESSLGSISPQAKLIAVGDSNKQLLSSGIEVLFNLTSWFKFYSRFAYVSSAGYWKSGSDLDWWDAYMQLQFFPGQNTKLTINVGNGNDTSEGFVSTSSLIEGATYDKTISMTFEYWF